MEAGNSTRVPEELRQYLTDQDLETIACCIEEIEKNTTGEVVVHLNASLLAGETPRGRAQKVFYQLGINKTREANGILLFFTFKERKFEILADAGISRRVTPDLWLLISGSLESVIQKKGLTAGICEGVRQLGKILMKYFPTTAEPQVNELRDDVTF